MTESPETKRSRLRWVTLGEAIAIAALILSGLGLWHEWRKAENKPVVVEEAAAIPGSTIELGSDGELDANAVEDALGKSAPASEGRHSVQVRIAARYVEAGADKTATGSYNLTYKVRDRLIGGKSLRLLGLSR
jgi:hypothetical protein